MGLWSLPLLVIHPDNRVKPSDFRRNRRRPRACWSASAELADFQIIRCGVRLEQRRAKTSFLHPREGFYGGVARSFRQSLALAESSCMVELEQYCRSLTGRIGRLNTNAVQLEGLAPAVHARVEEADELRWVANQGAEVASLVVIATGAGPGEAGR